MVVFNVLSRVFPGSCHRRVIDSHVSSIFFIFLTTNFVQGSLDCVITNLTVKILTNCHNLFGSPFQWPGHLCSAKMHSRPDQSMKWLCGQRRFVPLEPNSCLMFLYFREFHPCQWSCQMWWVWNSFYFARTTSGSGTGPHFCSVLSPSPFVFLGITKFSRELNFLHRLVCQFGLVHGTPGGVW